MLAAVAEHHHGQRVGDRRRSGQLEDLRGEHQADRGSVAIEVLSPLDGADVVGTAEHDPIDAGEREGVGLAADLDEQRADHRHRDRQLQEKGRLPPRLRGHPDAAAHGLHHALHGVQAHPAARDLRDLVLGGEARQEEELEQFHVGELVGDLPGDEPAEHGPGPQLLDIHAAAVVGDGDVEHAAAVPRLEHDRADRRLAGGRAGRRRLDPVVERVADQVRERRLELVEDVAVDTGLLAADLEPHLLAEGAGDVPHQSGKTVDAVGERSHAADDHLVVETIGEVLVAPGEALEVLDVSRQGGEELVGPFPRDRDGGGKRGRHDEVACPEPLVEGRQRVALLHLLAPQREQSVDERPQLPRLHQRLAREPDQPGEAVGRDADHAIEGLEAAAGEFGRGRQPRPRGGVGRIDWRRGGHRIGVGNRVCRG